MTFTTADLRDHAETRTPYYSTKDLLIWAATTIEAQEKALEGVTAKLKRQQATIDRYKEAFRLIAAGTICPDLFPNERNRDVLAVKTAMTIAMAALEHREVPK